MSGVILFSTRQQDPEQARDTSVRYPRGGAVRSFDIPMTHTRRSQELLPARGGQEGPPVAHPDRQEARYAESGRPNPSWPIGSELGYVVWTLAVRRFGVNLGVYRFDKLT